VSDPHNPVEEHTSRHESRAATTYHAFLKEVEHLIELPKELTERATIAVLSALEQRVFPEESRNLEAQLPSKLRELLGRVRAERQRRFGRNELFRIVGAELGKKPEEVEPIVRAVFRAVREKISEGEAQDLAAELPRDIAELWLHP
jgi:uncharacterized protein (DUF2267 family)